MKGGKNKQNTANKKSVYVADKLIPMFLFCGLNYRG